MGVYWHGIKEPCTCNIFCRNLNLLNQIHYVVSFSKFSSYFFHSTEIRHWTSFLLHAFGKIFIFLHLWWLWEGTTTWNYSLPVPLFFTGFFCPGQALEILSVLAVMSQWRPHAIIVNSNTNTVLACIFSQALSFSPNTPAKEFTELLSQQSAASRQNMQDTADLQNSQQGTQIPWKPGK